MTKLKSIFQTVKVISLALILSFGVSLVYAWTAPTGAPTLGNSTAPLNTGSLMQGKEGTLLLPRVDGVAGIESFGKAAFATVSGLVGVGTASPWAKLTIENTYDPNIIPDLAVGNPDFASSDVAFTNGLTSVEAKISTESGGSAGESDFRIATRSNGGFEPGSEGLLKDRFVVDWDGTVGINTSFPTEALTVGGVIETKAAGPGGSSGIKFNNGSVQTAASPFGNVSVFNASGTFSVPVGVTRLWVEVYGGGGGGMSGGGGAGGVAMGFKDVPSGTTSYPVTVGAGGLSTYDSSNSCYIGSNGGATSFSTLSATGGTKGYGNCAGVVGSGLGGVGSGGVLNQRGGPGQSFSPLSSGGSNNRSGGGTRGVSGSSFGGGGGAEAAGGAGGVVIWY